MIARALILICCFAGAAHAQVKPPVGWTTDPAMAVSQSKRLGQLPQFGGIPAMVATDVFQAKGASLFVTRVTASIAGLDAAARNGAASAQLDGARQSVDHSSPHALEGTFEGGDPDTKVRTTGRVVIAADAKRIVAVMGECVFAADVAKDIETACTAALATLDPDIAPASRVDLAIVKVPPVPVTAGSGSSSAPSLVDGSPRPSLPPMQIPQEQREPDRRPIYVGLGLIVLAAIFYWNRKNREKLERDYERRTADKPDKPEPEPAEPKRDRDADDLHAAAADDGTKEDSKS